MTTWNYRLYQETDANGEQRTGIYEVFYLEDGTVDLIALNPVTLESWSDNGVVSIKQIIQRLTEAIDKPILTEADFSV